MRIPAVKTLILLALAFGGITTNCLHAAPAYLDPSKFASLGAFDPSANVVVDVKAGLMSGGANFQGVFMTNAGTAMLVFTFSSVSLRPGVSVAFTNVGTGSAAIALLSQSSAVIDGVVDGSGETPLFVDFRLGVKGGPGGWNCLDGPGAGVYNGGGSFGGVGGRGELPPTRDLGSESSVYSSDLSARLVGGSGGGVGLQTQYALTIGLAGYGGGGGGAVQIGALTTMSINGRITVDGGGGQVTAGVYQEKYNSGTFGISTGPGGSGGSILLHAPQVQLQGRLSVHGGSAVKAKTNQYILNVLSGQKTPTWDDYQGGSGGGGRILIAYRESFTNSGTVDVSGGTIGAPGGAGTFDVRQDATVPDLPIPVITSDPQNQTNVVGTSATFTISAEGAGNHFGWFRDGRPVGSDSPSLTIPAVTDGDGGNYYVTVSNVAGSVPSQTAKLVVISPRISAAIEANTVVLRWPDVLSTAILESATNLSQPINWLRVPTITNATAVAITNKAEFFRWRLP